MNWRPVPLLATPLLGALLLVAGCGDATPDVDGSPATPTSASSAAQSAGGLPGEAVVTYAFHDSSVPPPYHRSITLTVTREQARIVVDSYGDVLADETTPTPAATWDRLGSTLAQVQDLAVVVPEQGCVGGTSVELSILAGGTTLLDVAPEFCAGANEAAGVAIDEWIAPARDLFPATDVLAPEQP